MRNPRTWTKALLVAVGATLLSAAGVAWAADDMGKMDMDKMDHGKKAAKKEDKREDKNSEMRLEIAITDKGFEPNKVEVKKGEPVELVFTRKTDQTCAKEVILDTGAKKIEKPLPLNKPVAIKAKFTKTGDLKYTCKMNMVSGTVSVQ
jgi:plastocyanin domain-containing protein